MLGSKTGVVGVLATPRTLLTPAFAHLAERYAGQAKIILQPCPHLVPMIERLELDCAALRKRVTGYIQPLLAQGADTLVLGCTHYNFIADVIADVAGPTVTIVRTEMAVAKQLQLRLAQALLLNTKAEAGADKFYSSGELDLFNRQLLQLWPTIASALPLLRA